MKTDTFQPLTSDEMAKKTEPVSSKDEGEAILPVPHVAPSDIPNHPLGKPSAVWEYCNKDGQLLFKVCRWSHPDGTKDYSPLTYRRFKDGSERWVWKGLDAPRPLYGLDRLFAKPYAPVIVCEGEKSADAAGTIFPDYVAITSPNGANAAHKADWLPIAGETVTIWPDNDDEGLKYATDVARLATEAGAKSVSIVKIPEGFPHKWDLADAIPAGFKDCVREEMLKNAALFFLPIAGTTPHSFKFIPVGEITSNFKPTSYLVDGYIEQNSMVEAFGVPASGKSLVALDIACCVATGTSFHGQKVSQGAVFYIAGEGHNGLARRFMAWEQLNGVSLKNAPLFVAERPAQLLDQECAQTVAAAVEELINKTGIIPKLIVIDTLARNFGDGDENSTRDMNMFVQHVDDLKDRWKATAIIVHHSGHSDKNRARGSIALKAALDNEYLIQKSGDKISMKSTKTKESSDPAPLYFEIVTVPLKLPHNGADICIEGAALVKIDNKIQPSREKLSSLQQQSFDILQNLISNKGQMRSDQAGGAIVKCISLDEYRKALIRAKIVKSDKPDNVGRSIRRILNDLENKGITASYEDFIWIPDKPDKTGRTKNK